MNLVIDYSIVAYSNYYVRRNFEDPVNPEALAEMIIKSGQKIIMDVMPQYGIPERVFWCCDNQHTWREMLYDGYKAGRPDKTDLYEAVNRATDIIEEEHEYKFTNIPYLEADDLGFIISQHSQECVLVSADDDWLQFVTSPNIQYFNFRKKTFTHYDELGYYTAVAEKLLYGCKGDNIPRLLYKGFRKYIFKEIVKRSIEEMKKDNYRSEFYVYVFHVHNTIANPQSEIYAADCHRNYLLANYSIDNYLQNALVREPVMKLISELYRFFPL